MVFLNLHLIRCFSRIVTFRRFSTSPKSVDNVSFCVIGNGSKGNSHSLFLNYNDRIFMFNCGGGLQRTIPDFGFKSSKIEHFFLTSNSWHNVSGLSSLLLSRFDGGVKEFNITGFDSQNIIKECTSFDTKLRRVKYNYFDCKENINSFNYEKLNIKPVVVKFDGIESVIYLGKIASQNGQINLDKCFQLRVPRQMVTTLEKGSPIQLNDGRTIRPTDVSDDDQPEKYFIIFECLHSHYLNKLEADPKIQEFLKRCDCIVHFTKDSFLSHRNYKHFFEKLNSTHHLLITESNPSLCLHSAHRFQTQLNFVDSELFPLLKEKPPVREIIRDSTNENVIYSQSGLTYNLRPHSSHTDSLVSFEKIPALDFEIKENVLLHKDGTVRDGLEEMLAKLKEQQNHLPKLNAKKFPEFVFLGTASSLSLPIRNVPSILVNLSNVSSILLDCGENTYGQLLRFYGEENIDKILERLNVVFISHHHSDHHMGLIQLIQKRLEVNTQKLHVVMPPMVSKFLRPNNLAILNLESLITKYNYILSRNFAKYKANLRILLDIEDVDLIPVNHCAFSYAISIVTKSGFKFVYSGDTQPCDNLVKYGSNCDLLIHEATVEDNLVNFARANFHSTLSEAIQAGISMNAKFTILTHFSQRYGKLPFLPDSQQHPNVALAFDNMRISPNEFARVTLIYDALKCMYSKHLNNLSYKTEMYNRKYNNK